MPREDAPNLIALANAQLKISSKYQPYPAEIRAAINNAKSNNVKDLRVFEDWIGMTILMCNPDDSDGWMHVSLGMPYLEHEQRPTIRIEKRKHPEALKNMRSAFDALFNDSKPA